MFFNGVERRRTFLYGISFSFIFFLRFCWMREKNPRYPSLFWVKKKFIFFFTRVLLHGVRSVYLDRRHFLYWLMEWMASA